MFFLDVIKFLVAIFCSYSLNVNTDSPILLSFVIWIDPSIKGLVKILFLWKWYLCLFTSSLFLVDSESFLFLLLRVLQAAEIFVYAYLCKCLSCYMFKDNGCHGYYIATFLLVFCCSFSIVEFAILGQIWDKSFVANLCL